MRPGRALTALAAAITVVATGVAVRALASSPLVAAPAEGPTAAVPPAPAASVRLNGDSIAQRVIARNPFRAHRTPAVVRFNPDLSPGAGPPPMPGPPRPTLALVGVVLGAEPAALVDGLPGAESTRALRVGETVAGYRLREVHADRAVVAAPDTTYVLFVRTRSP